MKNQWLTPLLFSLLFLSGTVQAQDDIQKSRWLYLETGMDFMECSAPDDKSYIRADNTPYSYYYETSYVAALLFGYHATAKFEIKAMHEKLGISGGIKYSHLESSIGKEEYWETGTDYFFVMISQDGTNTEYLKVKDIIEKSGYVGVPVEFKFYPYENRKIQMYYKIGVDFNFRTGSKTNISFSNSLMNQYENQVAQIIEKPWSFYSSMHLGIGVKIGSFDKPGINLEARIPEVMLYKKSNSFINPNVGGGIALSVRIPL